MPSVYLVQSVVSARQSGNDGSILDDDVIEGKSVTMTRRALLNRLVGLLSVLLFNFDKKMTKITVILR